MEINEKGFEFYYNLPSIRRPKGYISYDFRLKHKSGSTILINHKLTPVILNEEGDLWISLCLVTLSTARKTGNMNIFMQDEGVKYHYSFRTKKFQAAKNQSLTATEKQVIQLLSMGNSSRQIAAQLSVSENTIKFHKKNVFRKLGSKQ
ncbi:MAG: helix-turn-helix transcriptional regulator [Bacteroidales bacterium]|nr:helix-turn-helix transcriptional regulator [Bacteroidales bacterium]